MHDGQLRVTTGSEAVDGRAGVRAYGHVGYGDGVSYVQSRQSRRRTAHGARHGHTGSVRYYGRRRAGGWASRGSGRRVRRGRRAARTGAAGDGAHSYVGFASRHGRRRSRQARRRASRTRRRRTDYGSAAHGGGRRLGCHLCQRTGRSARGWVTTVGQGTGHYVGCTAGVIVRAAYGWVGRSRYGVMHSRRRTAASACHHGTNTATTARSYGGRTSRPATGRSGCRVTGQSYGRYDDRSVNRYDVRSR